MAKFRLFIIVLLASAANVWAAESLESAGRNVNSTSSIDEVTRSQKNQNGLYFSAFGDPGFNWLGINYLHALDRNWRLRAGLGTLFEAGWSIGGGVDYRPFANSRFRPVMGLDVNLTRAHGTETHTTITFGDDFIPTFDSSYNDITVSIWYSTLKVGVEYEAPSGFLVGLAVQGACRIGQEECIFDPYPSIRIGTMF